MRKMIPVFELSSEQITETIANLQRIIPPPEELCAELVRRRLAPMEVRNLPQADFVTPELDIYLRFLKASGIRTAMYHYEFYSEQQLELLFKLPEANINLFERRAVAGMNRLTGYQPEESDYKYYLQYCEFMKNAANPQSPHTLWLFTLYQGHTVACRIHDDWIRRTGLPTVQTIMQAASNTRKYGNYDQGIIRFRFENNSPDAPKPQAAENAEPAVMPAVQIQPVQEPQAERDPNEAYQRILNNIEKGRIYSGK